MDPTPKTAVSLPANESSAGALCASTLSATSPPGALSATPPPAVLSDAELLAATRGLVGRSNQLLASLLAHLAEVEARGIHRIRACASLYTYLIYELRFSEDESFRRVTAARLVRRFPALLDAIAAGELHLTGLLMLGPHLTAENLGEVLARAKHRTKKEIARLVRMIDPLPDVPPRIEPLGPAPARLVSPTPTWSRFASSMNPVRELAPGDRPRDWTENTEGTNEGGRLRDDVRGAVGGQGAEGTRANGGEEENLGAGERRPARRDEATLPEVALPEVALPEVALHAHRVLPHGTAPARLTPQRYAVQFTASEEYVKLVEEAKALLSHSAPRASLDEIHLRAMRDFVAELKRQRYAVTTRLTPEPEPDPEPDPDPDLQSEPAPKSESGKPRRRGRYVSAAVRRAVFARDAGRCTYTGDSGDVCRETQGLELHHLRAFARGGEHSEENLTLRCRAHNALAAEEDFGRDFIQLARDSTEHEPWTAHQTRQGDALAAGLT